MPAGTTKPCNPVCDPLEPWPQSKCLPFIRWLTSNIPLGFLDSNIAKRRLQGEPIPAVLVLCLNLAEQIASCAKRS